MYNKVSTSELKKMMVSNESWFVILDGSVASGELVHLLCNRLTNTMGVINGVQLGFVELFGGVRRVPVMNISKEVISADSLEELIASFRDEEPGAGVADVGEMNVIAIGETPSLMRVFIEELCEVIGLSECRVGEHARMQ